MHHNQISHLDFVAKQREDLMELALRKNKIITASSVVTLCNHGETAECLGVGEQIVFSSSVLVLEH